MTSLKTALSTIGERAKHVDDCQWRIRANNGAGIVDIECDHGSRIASSVHYLDAEFIAAARQDVPKLLAVIDKLIQR